MIYLCTNLKRYLRRILCAGALVSPAGYAELRHFVVDVQIIGPERRHEYSPTLLRMILEASKAEDEVIDYIYSDRHFSQARWLAEVENTNVNAPVWAVTTQEREQLLRPIRVPMFKGMIGWRILMIRREDQSKFSKANNLKDLAKFRAGQGNLWPDADILEANGLPVMLGASIENLYKMLPGKRFDYFPRGIHELTPDAKYIHANSVVPEEELLLVYPSAAYFFVSKKNVELAERLERGWEIILKNGEFDKFFFSHPQIVDALAELKRHKRKIIQLNNPLLPEQTPLANRDYWLDLANYQYQYPR